MPTALWGPPGNAATTRLDGVGVEIHGADVRADVGEGPRRRLADALGGARHDDAVTLQSPACATSVQPTTSCSAMRPVRLSGDDSLRIGGS